MLTVRDGRRYIVESGEPPSAFLELEAMLLQLQPIYSTKGR